LSKRGPTLLVIEDAHDQAILVGVAARRAHPGLDVRMAHDGSQGNAYFDGGAPFEDPDSRPSPDLVILDLWMPEVDGFEVLSWLKERSSPVPCPVVVLTGSGDPDDEARARELGAVAVYRKPTDLEGLGRVVREIVHRYIGRGEIIAAHIWESG
jgi:DNA-binding response OmpR family regulator